MRVFYEMNRIFFVCNNSDLYIADPLSHPSPLPHMTTVSRVPLWDSVAILPFFPPSTNIDTRSIGSRADIDIKELINGILWKRAFVSWCVYSLMFESTWYMPVYQRTRLLSWYQKQSHSPKHNSGQFLSTINTDVLTANNNNTIFNVVKYSSFHNICLVFKYTDYTMR